MDVLKLEKPDAAAMLGNLTDVVERATQDPKASEYLQRTNSPQYLFWDKIRHKPRPKNISAEEFWAIVKMLRQYSPSRVRTKVRDVDGKTFSWQPLPGMDYLLHQVDMQLGGKLESSRVDSPQVRRQFISRGIMEEAIASSQLEGANTTRKVAKRMLLEKRKPVNQAEQMILNNYEAMLAVEERLSQEPLTMESLLDLHVTLTDGTIDDSEVGRMRRDKDEIVVMDKATNTIYHVPPPERFLKKEIKQFIAFANDDLSEQHFVHPLIKAIILHFWVGYLHPFTDGNGRLARTVFYWYLLRHRYWAFAYLPLSRVIKKSPIQYRNAYVYSEQDDNDLTYFIDYLLRKTEQAMRDFADYVKGKEAENSRMAKIARAKYHMNDRQIQMLRHMHKHPDFSTTINGYARFYNVSRLTGSKDLRALESIGFLESRRIGRETPFSATKKTTELFD